MKIPVCPGFLSHTLGFFCVGASVLGLLAACERSPIAVTPAAPDASQPSVTPPDAAGVERRARAHLAAQERITEQQLANRRALADVRGVGVQMQERQWQEMQSRNGEIRRSGAMNDGSPLLLAQSQSPSPAPTAQPEPSASATVAPKTDPKFQKPPTEDESDSMKPDAGRTKPSPSPAPSASPTVAPGKP